MNNLTRTVLTMLFFIVMALTTSCFGNAGRSQNKDAAGKSSQQEQVKVKIADATSTPNAKDLGWTIKLLEVLQPSVVEFERPPSKSEGRSTTQSQSPPQDQKWLVLLVELTPPREGGLPLKQIKAFDEKSKDYPLQSISVAKGVQMSSFTKQMIDSLVADSSTKVFLLFAVPATAKELSLQI